MVQADAVAVSQDGAAEVDESAVEGVLPDQDGVLLVYFGGVRVEGAEGVAQKGSRGFVCCF